MMMWHDGGSWFALVVLFLVVATAVAVLLVVRPTARGTRPRVDDAEQLLRRRLAVGEIDEDEFLRRISALGPGLRG